MLIHVHCCFLPREHVQQGLMTSRKEHLDRERGSPSIFRPREECVHVITLGVRRTDAPGGSGDLRVL
jgi:hypothetical protein